MSRAGLRLPGALLPDFTRTFDYAYGYLPIHERVAHWGRVHGFATRDLLDTVYGRDNRKLHVPGDYHPNAEGHRLLAGGIVEALLPMIEAVRHK